MTWALRLSKLSRRRKGVGPWIFALLLFGASLAIRFIFSRWLEPLRFLTFYPAIAASTLLCGWPQGVLVLILSTLAAWYYFFEPFNSFETKDANTIVALIGFLLGAGFIVLLIAAMRELVRRLEAAKHMQEELFRELQHRVANNLQLVVVMLQNARRKLRDNPDAAEAILQAEDRIAAMSQLHRRLHDGATSVEGLELILKEALAEVFRDLPIDVRLDIRTEADLSVDQLMAVTLLVNEAATNAVKHAFSKGLGALFEVSLSQQENGRLQLIIRDDGPGIDSAVTTDSQTRSLGMGIMHAFAHQLGGPLQVVGVSGTTLSVEFGLGNGVAREV